MNKAIKLKLSDDLKIALTDFLKQTPESLFNISNLLERPRDTSFGQLSLPIFGLAKVMKKSPQVIAKDLKESLNLVRLKDANILHYVQDINSVSGFVNFQLKPNFLTESLIRLMSSPQIGHVIEKKNQKLVIDYSSPNVAKPMNVGHLRATVIGQAIKNLAETQGYNVVGLNHLGDWGVQFGKLAWAYVKWKTDYDFQNSPFKSLFDMYVRFHDEAEKDPELNEQGAKTFIRLEKGDPEIVAIWKMFVQISMKEYQRLWDRLGVKHDLVKGESFYSDQLDKTTKFIEDKGLLEESQGAFVVNVGEDMPPCLIKKSDGASLYATRDIASAIYRHDVLKADLNLYVVGVDQTLHFKQVFRALDLMGFDWSKNCHHISFGMYRFKDQGKMSTRKGRAIFLEDVLNKSVEMVKDIIEVKNPDLPNKEQVAEQVGVGAVIFNDLVNDRVKDVDFDWNKILDFEGDSGPYIQYTCVRCYSVMEKFEKLFSATEKIPANYADSTKDIKNLDSNLIVFPNFKEETDLICILLSYEHALEQAFEKFKPNVVANYLLDLAKEFNSFYNKHRILDIENPELTKNRVLLTFHTLKVLKAGLSVLNIQTPEKM